MNKKMCRKMKKGIALLLACTMVLGFTSGCGAEKEQSATKSGATNVEIKIWRGGQGIEWLDNMIKVFNEKHPEYNVFYTDSIENTAMMVQYGMKDIDTADLYFSFKNLDTTYMEPLNDVLDTVIEGESKSIKEKFSADYLALEEVDGNYYSLTWGGGVVGIMYNTELFEQAGVTQMPRTTDELGSICETLVDSNIVPFCHFSPAGYYSYIDDLWYAQYEGYDYFWDFYMNPTKEKMLAKDGRYEVIKAEEKLITPDTVLQGSNSGTHLAMQTRLLDGQAAMMINGSWIIREAGYSDKLDKFDMMKTPILSSITDKLSTVKTEKELRKLITAIDNVEDSIKSIDTYKDGDNYMVDGMSVASADWEYVKNARNMVYSNYGGLGAHIPNYSDNIDGAKEFLKFMYSDEGYQIYTDTLQMSLPFSLSSGEVDTTNWKAFSHKVEQFKNSAERYIETESMTKHDIFKFGGAGTFANLLFESAMCTRNEQDRRNAEQVWKELTDTIEDKYEDTWMANVQ